MKKFLSLIAIGFLFWISTGTHHAYAAITFVASTATSTVNTTAATTTAISTTGANFIAIGVTSFSSVALPTITDSLGNTWTALTSSAVAGNQTSTIFYAKNATVGSSQTFSATCASACYVSIDVEAFSGVESTSPFDQENGATSGGAGSTLATGSVTPSQNGELIFTSFGFGAAGLPLSINSSFNLVNSKEYTGSVNFGGGDAYIIQTTAGAVNPTWTRTNTGLNSTRIATFKAAPVPTYCRTMTVDHTKVPNTDQTNFPIAVASTSYSFLNTVANGGKATNAEGFDIGFYSNASCVNQIPWEVENYSPSTGNDAFWVNVPSVSHTTDTVFYLGYGNSGITTDHSATTTVWSKDGNFKNVYHLKETGTASAGDYKDSTVSANNSTNTSNQPSVTTGQVYNGESFGGTGANITTGAAGINPNTSGATIELWTNQVDFTVRGGANQRLISDNIDNNNVFQLTTGDGSGGSNTDFSAVFYKGGSEFSKASPTGQSTGVFHYVVGTFDGTNITKIYVDGALPSQTATSGFGKGTADNKFYIGIRSDAIGQAAATLDEVRLSNTTRSADYVATSYNNELCPDKTGGSSCFYTMGPESSVTTVPFKLTVRGLLKVFGLLKI